MRLVDVDELGVGRCSKDVLPAVYCAGWNGLLSLIEKAPTVDAVPVVHGRWIPFHSKISGDIQYCSACEIGFVAKSDYCPHCGAKMDGGAEYEAD